MRHALAAFLLFAVPAAARAQDDHEPREGLEVMDEVGLTLRGFDGGAEALSSNPALDVAASVRIVLPHGHGIGLGFDFAFDVSGHDAYLNTYAIDFFYFHPWIVPTDGEADEDDEDHWEVTPIFGAALGWADAGLTPCTGGCEGPELKARQKALDRFDAFLLGGRVGVQLDYVLAEGFLHLGFTATVRVMAASGTDEWRAVWSQSLLLRAGFRLDL